MPEPLNLHATTVGFPDAALLITGPSGSGKSGLALELIGLGAHLVADDRSLLTRQGGGLIATAPVAISGRIEARGMGILDLTPLPSARIAASVDLGTTQTQRLPEKQTVTFLGVSIRLFHKVNATYFAPALLSYLRSGSYNG